MSTTQKPAVLLLADGTVHFGKAFGKIGTTAGEICFNTGMTGYQEVFTDPSYYGQIIIMNNVHVGNYGTKDTDVESGSVKIRGLIGRNLEEQYSRKQANASLEQYLQDNNIVCIEEIDTRALVTHVREKGAMNCIISSEILDVEELKKELAKVPSMEGLELASYVSTEKPYTMGDEATAAVKVAVMDYGTKKNILQCMVDRGAFVKVFPAKTPISELKQFNPDGYFISNGPGDPSAMDYAVATVKEILKESKPTFGICLGHQLLALANDIETFKLHHGHRGLNHPVKNLVTGKCEITTQNHGFGVNPESVKKAKNVEITHVNLNDESIEGIRLKDKPAFSVQYHPEATPGPHDSRYLFDDFINLVREHKVVKVKVNF
ncbi:glutamine-hydrolyzing carbamoyl-phosphate synthase small subunit [Pseudoflavitalea sp. X16]|uniref:glutamine-hydrolyzing carbamoyl-phosphate synthase small subunit n=1 Tax=Paraflavitalea devenefica TaxID=2716334 RepID=UPI001421D5F3|nr:glutamine-hydrolyzing carbamoyl-phosphate synthase small subunit [Paraflavitalea devenefica]NII25679.1 glutamine-hydrolyzing carbamoyl-phosphate synthase small subunit [Paraflavitalea devenefica]